jgi:hypothetical protein
MARTQGREVKAAQQADFRVVDALSIVLLVPVSDAAVAWVEEHIGEHNGYQPQWPTVVVEPRYVAAILQGITSDGLRWNVTAH